MKKTIQILALLFTGILSAQTIVINGETYNYGLNPLNYLGLKKIDVSLSAGSAVDDDFAGSTLDAKWTVVKGEQAAVSLLDTVFSETDARYDLSRKTGILVQPANGKDFEISQDFTLANGESIILKASFGVNTSSNPANIIYGGISLTDSGPRSGNYDALEFNTTEDGWRLLQIRTGFATIGAFGDPGDEIVVASNEVYFRIAKTGGAYYCFYSFDGLTWTISSNGFTPASEFTKLFIYAGSDSTKEAHPLSVIYFEYLRKGSNNYDPWLTY